MSSSDFVKKLIENVKCKSPTSYVSLNEDWKFSVGRIMMTGILKNQFYRTADEAATEALPLLISAAQKDPMFVLRAACFARDSNMKGMVKVGLAAVAGQASDQFLAQDEVKNCAIGLLATFHPGQLLQFVELVKSKACGRGLGARPQKWVAKVMENWTTDKVEEFTLKYPTALNALLRLVHPNLNVSCGNLARYVLTSTGSMSKNGKPAGKKQKVVEYLKSNSTDSVLIAKTMLDESIPWDVIKGFAKMDKNVWLASLTQMGLSALLLNLRSLDEHGVFDTDSGVAALKMKLSEVQNGRSLPIDFAKPYIHCLNVKVRDQLLNAMAEVLQVDMPALQGKKIGVSVDISGSMSGETLQTAGLLSVPFVKSDLWFTTFDTSLHEEGSHVCPQVKNLPPIKQIKNLLSLRTNGGTDVGISIRMAIKQKRKLDLMVIVTDEHQNTGTPLMTVWKEYKKTVNPRAELWVINATNIPWHSADFGDPSVTVYQSMTPAIFKNLQFVGQDLVSAIENYELKTFNVTNFVSSPHKSKKEEVVKEVKSSSKFVNKVLTAKSKVKKVAKKKVRSYK